MRILPITLSVLMIFTPAYSAYASMLPTKGQIVQIGKKGGALIKTGAGVTKVTPVAIAGGLTYKAGEYAWAWCKNNQKKCKDKIGDAYEVICDLTSCEVTKNQDTSDSSESSDLCPATHVMRYRVGSSPTSYKDAKSAEGACLSATPKTIKPYVVETTYKEFEEDNTTTCYWKHNYQVFKGYTRSSHTLYRACVLPEQTQRIQLTEDELKELAKEIVKKMDDDDIKNYYNTDYDDITINNNYYYGDDIDNETNIDKYCESNACNEISKEIEQDINEKKYDIDDVTPENCTIEESTGKYIACSITINNEEDNETPPEDDKDQTTPKKEDEEPVFCKTSDLTKEVCEFFDWVDDEPEKPNDTKVNIEDEEEEKLNKNRINLDEGCPADQHIAVSMPWGYSTTIEFTYKPYCDFARDLKPYMTATGAIVSMYIVGSCGRRL